MGGRLTAGKHAVVVDLFEIVVCVFDGDVGVTFSLLTSRRRALSAPYAGDKTTLKFFAGGSIR